MKTVGILTFHFADNYGAVLQCYALRKAINDLPGFDAEIINYIPPQYKYPKRWDNTYEKHMFKQKRIWFDMFLKRRCGISKEVSSLVCGNEYDYYCAGSDQIWNTNDTLLEYFFPHIDANAKRISYAASIGIGVEDRNLNKTVLKKYLPQFKEISVRESEHAALIEKLIGCNCERVLDPTLLLMKDDYEQIVSTEILQKQEFIFLYWLNHNNPAPGVELANTLSRIYNIPVVHSIVDAPPYMFAKDGGCMFYEGIENFLWYIKNAKFVITNSYHGTIFSIQFERPFYTFIVESMRSRIDTLIETLEIGDRIVKRYLLSNQIEENIDFVSIQDKIERERRKSIAFLKKALDITTAV